MTNTDDPNLYLQPQPSDGLVWHPVPYTAPGGWHCTKPTGHLYSECGLCEASEVEGYQSFIFHMNPPPKDSYDNMIFQDFAAEEWTDQ